MSVVYTIRTEPTHINAPDAWAVWRTRQLTDEDGDPLFDQDREPVLETEMLARARHGTVPRPRKKTMKKVATIAAGAALAAGLAGCAVPRTDSHAHCAMKWADAYPGHPVCPDSPGYRAPATTQPSELDQQFSPEDAAFLTDLRGVWNFSFDAGSAVREAHAMCGMPKGQTASALPDITRLIDPGFTGGDEQLRVVMYATKFMKVAAEHFCPSK